MFIILSLTFDSCCAISVGSSGAEKFIVGGV